MGYGDYQLGNVRISRVYYVEGLGHNLIYVGQFWDSDLEVAFRKLKPKADIAMVSEQFSSGLAPQVMTLGILSSRLMPNLIPQPPYIPPNKNDWDILFQPMFDEFFNPPLSVVSLVLVATTPRPVDPTGSPVSTLIDQDTPSTSNPSTQEQEQSLIISPYVEESPKTPHFHDDPLHEDSTSQ
nr:integrase, catalytic region, zinc finger, CCHC-type, peptidase aspartic, catalytic [Tanacetum cinerariifolium]